MSLSVSLFYSHFTLVSQPNLTAISMFSGSSGQRKLEIKDIQNLIRFTFLGAVQQPEVTQHHICHC